MLTLQQVVTWLKGVELYSKGDYAPALKQFNQLINSPEYSGEVSKLAHNIATVYYKMEDHERATKWFVTALQKDPYLCITHFLFGQCLFDQEKYSEAAKEWDKCLEYMRGNTWINYQPLGLNFTLYSCEVMFNKSMAKIYSGDILPGVADLSRAGKEHKWSGDHNRIDKAYIYFNTIKDSLHRATTATPQPQSDGLSRTKSLSKSKTQNLSRSKSLARSKSMKHKQQQLQDNIRNRSSMGFGANYTNTFDVSQAEKEAALLLRKQASGGSGAGNVGLGIRQSPSMRGTPPSRSSPLAGGTPNLSRSQTLGGGAHPQSSQLQRSQTTGHAHSPTKKEHPHSSANVHRSQSTRTPPVGGTATTEVDLPTTVKMARMNETYKIYQISAESCLFSIHDNRLKNIVGCEQMASLLRGKDKEISSGGGVAGASSPPPEDSTEFSFVDSVGGSDAVDDIYDIDDYYGTPPSSNSPSSRGQRSANRSVNRSGGSKKSNSATVGTGSPPTKSKPTPIDVDLAREMRKVSFDSSLDTPQLNKLVDRIQSTTRDSMSSTDSIHAPKATKHRVKMHYIHPVTASVAEECSSPDTPLTPVPPKRLLTKDYSTRSPYPNSVSSSSYEDETITWTKSLHLLPNDHAAQKTDQRLRELRERDRREIRDGIIDRDTGMTPPQNHEFDPTVSVGPGRSRNAKFLTVDLDDPNQQGDNGRSKSPGSPMSPFILVT
ncbi:NADPH oxidase activator 1 [Yarrowia sp. C11]|nr:NADPH oxidase activator 1 [Yarrowia sp. E02]KAG5372539.1 NADPH oxidase activator 1 [Yarrowia sp. C11]